MLFFFEFGFEARLSRARESSVIIVLRSNSAQETAQQVCETLRESGLASQIVLTAQHKLVIVTDDASGLPSHLFSRIEGVEKVIRVQTQCPLALNSKDIALRFSNGTILGSGAEPVVIAGPCSVEGRLQLFQIAGQVKTAGAQLLRGGAFKPRTSPYDFRGLGAEALEYLKEARQTTGLPVVSEVMSAQQVELADACVDMFQIGARNMYNYELLKEVGRSRKPVLLKRAFSATISELLQAAEYILLEGNLQVVLCERGIRTFETHTRNTLDLSAVAALKTMTQLPVLVDPSHGTGRPELIRPMSRAAIACGADGLLIEVHNDPCKALSDGGQAITPSMLGEIVQDVKAIYKACAPEQEPTVAPSTLLPAGV